MAKHRNGPTDTIVLAFQGHYSRFTNMATELLTAEAPNALA